MDLSKVSFNNRNVAINFFKKKKILLFLNENAIILSA